MDKKRTAVLGGICGIVNIMLSAIGAIVVRRFFVKTLGNEYLGLTAIFSSILGLLLSMDCGVSGSLFYKIYKPIAEGDENGVATTFKLIKTVYLFRALIIVCIGVIILPFLPEICKSSSIDMPYIYRAYGIYLILTSFSFYIILYSFLLEALQKRYIVSIISVCTYFISVVFQIRFLVMIKSYLIYLIISILQPIILYIICRSVAKRKYPYIFKNVRLRKDDIKEIPQYLKMAIHTLGTVIASYTDAFLITAFTSIATLGMYDNYKVISTKVSSLLDQVTSSIKDPMRLLIAEGNKEKVRETLDNINFFIFVIAGVGSLTYLSLITPFVCIWLGDEYMLSLGIVATSAYTMFLASLNYISVDTYYYLACFKEDRISPIIEIIINLTISLFLGRVIGISGVLIGTVFYYFFQEVLRSRKVFSIYFGYSSYNYLLKYFGYSCIVLTVIIVETLFQIKISNGMMPVNSMIVNLLLTYTIFGSIVVLVFRKTISYRYFVGITNDFISKMNRIRNRS